LKNISMLKNRSVLCLLKQK